MPAGIKSELDGNVRSPACRFSGSGIVGAPRCKISRLTGGYATQQFRKALDLLVRPSVAKDLRRHPFKGRTGVANELPTKIRKNDVGQPRITGISFSTDQAQFLKGNGHASNCRRAGIEPFGEINSTKAFTRCAYQMHQQ